MTRAKLVHVVLALFLATIFLSVNVQAEPNEGVLFNIVADEYVDMMYLVAGDLDLDNKVDLVFSGWIDGGFIAFGEGNGMFEEPISISVSGSSNLTLGYVNTDALLDIIAVSNTTIYILLNNGDRTFTTTSWSNAAPSINFITTGYFNNDVFLDFVASPNKVYFGDGTGAFPSNNTLPFSDLYGADVSDFNLDGFDDLVVLEGSGTSTSRILLNDGNGNFSESSSLSLGALSISVSTSNALADFNNDGNPDFALITPVATACPASNYTSYGTVGLGDGNGGILATESFEVCGTAYNMTTADVNRDHKLDIVVADGRFKVLVVLLGNGDGTFQPPDETSFGTEEVTFVLAQGDYNRDGNPDFSSGGGLVHFDSIYSALNKQPGRPILPEPMVTTGFSSVAFEVINPEGFKISRLKNTVAGGRYERFDKDNDGQLDAQAYDYNLEYGEYTLVFRRRADITSPAIFDANISIGDSRHLTIFKDYETPGTAKGSAANDSIVFTISIDEFPQTVPESGETAFDVTPSFSWSGLSRNKFSSAISYDFQLDSKVDFSAPLISETGLANHTYSTSILLDRDKVYYWRVRSFDGAIYSDWSNSMAVYIGPFFCGDCNNDNSGPNILDLTFMVDYIFRGGPNSEILENADLNGDNFPSDILDLTLLVDFIFRGGAKPTCGI